MKIKIGSRKSKLAVLQAEWVARELQKKAPDLEIEFVRLSTQGDRDANTSLQKMGGKGVFVKEIEDALLKKEIDLAVHSLKDMPQELPDGLMLSAFPKREDPRDVFISRFGEQIHELPKGSIIGTSSPRRHAQIQNRFKDRKYRVVPIRGNVDTRLKKVEAGEFDAVIMAAAGLKRLGLEGEITHYLDLKIIMPAPCQGCLGLEIRAEDESLHKLVENIKDDAADIQARAERAFLLGVGGDCNIPLAGLAQIENGKLKMDAIIFDMKSDNNVTATEIGEVDNPEMIGALLAERLLHNGGSALV